MKSGCHLKLLVNGTGSQLALFWGRWVEANGSNLQAELGYKGSVCLIPDR